MNSIQTEDLLSLVAAIPPGEDVVRTAFSQLEIVAAPPHGAPCSFSAVKGMRLCIQYAVKTLDSPNAEAQKILDDFSLLEAQLKSLLKANERAELLCGLDGTKTRNPEWHFLSSTGSKRSVHCLATVYVGLKSLLAIHSSKALTNSTIALANQLLKEEDLTHLQISALLRGSTPEEALGQSWPRDLCRSWRDAMRHFSASEVPPPPSAKDRIASQMLDAALHATTSRRGGARTHRQLSKSQLTIALSQIGEEVAKDSIAGALGTIACITTLLIAVEN